MTAMLSVVTGCMFSGKTEELLRTLRREIIAKRSVLLFKPDIDTRYSANQVVSHSNFSLEAVPIGTTTPEQILGLVPDQTHVVGIDEVQFFARGIVEVCKQLLKRDINVVAAGLKQDFKGDPFGSMGTLLILADKITMLTAICNICGEEATNTQRMINGKPAPYDAQQVLVGGTESYLAVCNRHHQVPGRP
ncbi:thymidine kinase [candidate division WWE3 bacterium]|uniref:Thymidine kinase n=1 Tax=candidate division WWE3 bacterium TaxID=2053526 RepID=A0A7X9DKD2_UNCKA|nr:thymidine kinase [candidate division WWE3 bacterium]